MLCSHPKANFLTLAEIVYDNLGGGPLWLVVDPKGFLPARFLVPVEGVIASDGRLVVGHLADTVRQAPQPDLEEGLDSRSEEKRLYEYFDVPLTEPREVRVLKTEEASPGLEQSW